MKDILLYTLAIVAVLAAALAVVPWLFLVCWNAVMPHAFGLPELTFWQSVALLVLVGIVASFFRSYSKD